MSGVMGTSLQRSALYFDIVGHCRDHPVDSLTDTMSEINYIYTAQHYDFKFKIHFKHFSVLQLTAVN